MPSAPTTLPTTPPANPSQVFLGEIRSNSLCRPKAWPAKYAKVSFTQVTTNARMTQPTPKRSRSPTSDAMRRPQ